MNIFVSYTLRDNILNIPKLRSISSILYLIGNPYIDILHNKSKDPQNHVIDKLINSSILISCITPSFFQSEWVQLELKIAKDKNIPIVEFNPVAQVLLPCLSMEMKAGNVQIIDKILLILPEMKSQIFFYDCSLIIEE